MNPQCCDRDSGNGIGAFLPYFVCLQTSGYHGWTAGAMTCPPGNGKKPLAQRILQEAQMMKENEDCNYNKFTKDLLNFLMKIAWSDGDYNPKEREKLQRVRQLLEAK